MKELIINENEANQRLDRFMLKYFNNSTRSNVYRILRKKLIKVNGKRENENYTLRLGDAIEIFLADDTIESLRKEEKQIMSEDINLDIVYEDEDILVVNKPEGLLTHPDKNEYKKTLATKVHTYLKDMITRTFKPSSINRLDRNTSGLVIFCKNYESLKKYNKLMRNREIKKYYQCIVHGKIEKSGEVKGYLQKDKEQNIVKINNKNVGQFVHTKYKPLRYINNYTLLEVELLTGRTHQIRASLSKIGHPIVGDVKYGGKKIKGITTQVLHAYKLMIDDQVFCKESDEINDIVSKLK